MIPTIDLRNEAMALLAADSATINPVADQLKLKLAQNNIAPAESSLITDFVEATFPGYAEIALPLGAQTEGFDPTTLDSLIIFNEPVGGFVFSSAGPWLVDQTIFGYYLTNLGGTVLYGSGLLPAPVTFTGAGQLLDVGDVTLRLPANSIS